VKRGKTDAADAAAIAEAVTRPTMRFVAVKSLDQQSVLMLHKVRDLLVRQRTMLINALRGHLGSGGKISETAEGKLVRTLAEDEGQFARNPIVRKITDKEYLGRSLPVPVNMADLFRKYHYYLMEFPFELDPAEGWAFNSCERWRMG